MVNRIRWSAHAGPCVRMYAVTARILPSHWLDEMVAELLKLRGIDKIPSVRKHELIISIGVAFNWSEVHEGIIAVLKKYLFPDAEAVQLEDTIASTIRWANFHTSEVVVGSLVSTSQRVAVFSSVYQLPMPIGGEHAVKLQSNQTLHKQLDTLAPKTRTVIVSIAALPNVRDVHVWGHQIRVTKVPLAPNNDEALHFAIVGILKSVLFPGDHVSVVCSSDR